MASLLLTILLGSSIGMLLGIIGSGGSVLTVPIFVYLLGMDAKTAIAASLVVVGVTSLVGSFSYYRRGLVDLRVGLGFGLVAMLGTYLGARLAQFMDGDWQLLLFAVLIVVASLLMLRKSFKHKAENQRSGKHDYGFWTYPFIIAEGLVVGVLTGLVGIGGGFMVVPALVLFTGLPMQVALGTSLFIITLKSISGAVGYLDQVAMPWVDIVVFSGIAVCGVVLGAKLMHRFSQRQLEQVFSVFLLLIGAFVFVRSSMAL